MFVDVWKFYKKFSEITRNLQELSKKKKQNIKIKKRKRNESK